MLSVAFLLSLGVYVAAAAEPQLVFVQRSMSFWDAENSCVSLRGHLASIHDHKHNEKIVAKCRENGAYNCWIGLQHRDGSVWAWTDRTSVDYTFWQGGKPDTSWSINFCGAILQNSTDGHWVAQNCDAPQSHSSAVCIIGGAFGNVTTPKPVTYDRHVPTVGPVPTRSGTRLAVKGTDLVMNGEKVFLSGVNQAWIAYGHDFGDNNYEYRHVDFEKYLKLVYDNGGNSIRVWVHVEGAVSPHFDATGHVTGLDQQGTFINDVKIYLRKALQYNILIFFCLWNGAVAQAEHFHLDGLIKDTSKLQSYLDKALIPWVKAVKDEPALGGWDIINEFEGEVTPDLTSTEPCFSTKFLHNSGAGWAGKMYSTQEFLRFINLQADAIRQADPQALVTAGSWNARSNVDKWGGFNVYKDECLIKAGGKKMGTLTFYSSHTYAWGGKYDDLSPFRHSFADYGLNKPLVVAEFNSVVSGGWDIEDQFKYIYTHGYAGGWTWHAHADGANSDSTDTQMRGLRFLKGKNDQKQGGRVPLKL